MEDYRSILWGPIFVGYGVPAALETGDGTIYDQMTAIDMTTGIGVPGLAEIETVRPVALMLVGDLYDAGIALENLDNGAITLNSITWHVIGYRVHPSPNGVADGEVMLMLEGDPLR